MMFDECNDPIMQFKMDVQSTIERVERLRPIVKACQDAIQRSECKAKLSVGKRNQLRPQVEIIMVCISLDETIPLFRELAKEGLRTDKKDTHHDRKLFDMIAMREYNLGPDVSVTAMLIGDGKSKNCRMEQVGVKEVPIFEMKCD